MIRMKRIRRLKKCPVCDSMRIKGFETKDKIGYFCERCGYVNYHVRKKERNVNLA